MDWFDKLIVKLKNKYNMVSIEDIKSFYYEKRSLKNARHITFDDRDKTFHDVISPVLQKHKIYVSVFVSPDIATSNNKNFWFQEITDYNQEYLRELLANVLEIDKKLISNYSILTIFKTLKIDEVWSIIELYKNKYNPSEKRPHNMTLNELLEIDKSNYISIGAHTIRHPILANEKDVISEQEIVNSITQLSVILAHSIECFAYCK